MSLFFLVCQKRTQTRELGLWGVVSTKYVFFLQAGGLPGDEALRLPPVLFPVERRVAQHPVRRPQPDERAAAPAEVLRQHQGAEVQGWLRV